MRRSIKVCGSLTDSLFPKYNGLKIKQISVYQVDLPLHEKAYKWSGGNQVEVFDATVVRITTEEGLEGFGENTPLGPSYLPAYAQGTRAGIATLGKSLIGLDPTRLHHINTVMDKALKGHPYVKSAIDMACWDILGKVANLPVCELLGGRFNDNFKLYRAISQDTPERMAKNVEDYIHQGYRIFQLKVGGSPQDDIMRIRAVRKILDEQVITFHFLYG
jgi:L-alanine-DL-glutamate epimerase-like enolase superfamily enzyme